MVSVPRLFFIAIFCLFTGISWATDRAALECEVRAVGPEIRLYQLNVGDVFRVKSTFRDLARDHLTRDEPLLKSGQWMTVTDRGPATPSGDFPLTLRVVSRGELEEVARNQGQSARAPVSLFGPEIQIMVEGSSALYGMPLPYRGRALFTHTPLQAIYGTGPRPPRTTSLVTQLKSGYLIRYRHRTYMVDLSWPSYPLRRVSLKESGQVSFGRHAQIHGRIDAATPDLLDVPPGLDLQVLATGVPKELLASRFHFSERPPPITEPLPPGTVFMADGGAQAFLVLESFPVPHEGIARLKLLPLLNQKPIESKDFEQLSGVGYDLAGAEWAWQGLKPAGFPKLDYFDSNVKVFGTADFKFRWSSDWLALALKSLETQKEERSGTETLISDFIFLDSPE